MDCKHLQVADFGLSRQAIASKVETNTYGTGINLGIANF